MRNKSTVLWFLLGLGSRLQIVASLSFTELFVYMSAPVLVFKEYQYLKKNGMLTFFYLSISVVVGCLISSVSNHTGFDQFLRGSAVTTLLPCTIIVSHWVLRRDMSGFKWMLIGAAISNVLSTFIFQQSVEVAGLAGGQEGAAAAQAIMAGPIFWGGRLGPLITAFPQGWYLQCPLFISVVAPAIFAGFALLTTVSGRSAAIGALASAVIVFLGGKTPSRIRRNICNRFWVLAIVSLIGIFTLKGVYSFSVENGWLGEEARAKYERQTRGDSSLIGLLLGGRMESFCGLIACVDKPIVGFGPWAVDNNGYVEQFLNKYATVEDYFDYIKWVEYYKKLGCVRQSMIPCHAYITEFWLWYGIMGLVFWVYVVFVLLRYLRQDCWAVPQWYMWLAASIPAYFWNVFFSPWADRFVGILVVVACLMVRAVRLGRQTLPDEMIQGIRNAEGR